MDHIAYLDLPPLESAGGQVKVPGSKSISNRALLLAGLSAGDTVLTGLLDSDDTQVMLQALRQLGCGIELVHPDRVAQGVHVRGIGGVWRSQQTVALFLGNAGTVMRPLTAVLALLGGDFELSGVPRMHERPIKDLVEALQALGCHIDYTGVAGFPPLRIHPAELNDAQLSRPIQVKGNVSSQFLSALLMALPLVARTDITIEVIGELISKPYIVITLKLLKDFGIQVQSDESFQRFVIPAGSRYTSPQKYAVEGDASSASYFIAAGAIAASAQAPVIIEGVGAASIQGDIRFIEAARAMGAVVHAKEDFLEVYRGSWPLKAIDLDCNHIPDAAMTLAVMALYAQGTTRLSNIASWRVKETDRLDAMAAELRKLGAQVVQGDDFIEVSPPVQWQKAQIATYDDHRMAMCFSLAAFNQGRVPVRIQDPACVNKTYPGYFDDFFALSHCQVQDVPVIAIDGPTASGKGTLANVLAQRLGFHYLDSGALYRVTALAAMRKSVSADDIPALAALAQNLPVAFHSGQVWYEGDNVTEAIRAEKVGMLASRIAAYPAVREALFALQRAFRRLPGLIADGRDMGTVVFPDAVLKVFLTATAAARAQRRYKQLNEKGIFAKIDNLRSDLEARDAQDMNRAVAPLKPAEDAHLLDNSALTIEQSVQQVLSWWEKLHLFE